MALQTPFNKPIYGETADLSGPLGRARGNDPTAEPTTDAVDHAIINFWDDSKQPMAENPAPSRTETANSVSGLPLQPQRFQPDETPPDPPSMQMRNPGTIDKK